MFPEFYRNQAFIAEHGSWNRSTKIGYQISIVTFDKTGKAMSYQPFIKGWLQRRQNNGAPSSIFTSA